MGRVRRGSKLPPVCVPPAQWTSFTKPNFKDKMIRNLKAVADKLG
jgi:hypothetical protein